MKRIYLTVDDHLTEITTLEKGCWVHLQNPTKEEVDGLNARFAIDPTFLAAALDEEESARIEHEPDKGQTLIVVDIPYVESEGSGYVYSTIPLGIVLVDDIITSGATLLECARTLMDAGAASVRCVTLAVLAEREGSLARIMKRDGIDRQRAEARLNSQPDDEFYRARADLLLRNGGTLAAFEEKIDLFVEKYCK